MIVVDASVLVSHLVPQDVHHATSRAWFRQQLETGTRLVAPIILLTEVGGAIARRTGDADLGHRAVDRIQQIPTLRLLSVEHSPGLLATRLAIDLRLRGADAIYVVVAEQLDIPLVSWDNEHRERALSRIAVMTPARI